MRHLLLAIRLLHQWLLQRLLPLSLSEQLRPHVLLRVFVALYGVLLLSGLLTVESLNLLLGGAALLTSILAVCLALGVAIRLKELEQTAYVPRSGLAKGSPAPRQPLTDLLHGDDSWLARSFVLFASATCEPCRDLLAGLREQVAGPDMPMIVVETSSSDGSLSDLLPGAALRVTDTNGGVRAAFRAHATPHSFLVRDGRIVQQQLGADIQAVIEMLSAAGSPRTATAESAARA